MPLTCTCATTNGAREERTPERPAPLCGTVTDAVRRAYEDPEMARHCDEASSLLTAASVMGTAPMLTDPAGYLAAYLHATTAQPPLPDLTRSLLWRASQDAAPVTLTALLAAGCPAGADHSLSLLLTELVDRDGRVSDDLAAVLLERATHDDTDEFVAGLRMLLVRPLPISQHGIDVLSATTHPLLLAVVVLFVHGEHPVAQTNIDLTTSLTDEQLATLANRPAPGVAVALLGTPALRCRLTDEALTTASAALPAWRGQSLARTLLSDAESTGWPDALITRLLTLADRSDVRAWLTGELPVPPTGRMVTLFGTHPLNPHQTDGVYLRERVVDNVVSEFAHAFDTMALHRHGVRDVLDAAPIAVVDLAELDPAQTSAFSSYLHDRIVEVLPDTADTRTLARDVARRIQPATVTELVVIVAALTDPTSAAPDGA